MALFRVAEKNVDLVVTFNVPIKAQDDGAVDKEAQNNVLIHFEAFVRSLRIADFGLFV